MKVILTEKQFREYLNYQINEAFVESGSKPKISDNNPYISAARNRLLNQIKSLYAKDVDYRRDAKNMGFDPNMTPSRQEEITNKLLSGFTTDLKNEILWGVKILRQYTDANGNSVECPDCLPPIFAVYSSKNSSIEDVEIIDTH